MAPAGAFATTRMPHEISRQRIDTLETPCLLLDIDRLERNCARMLARAGALGVKLRPHVKSPKSIGVAARAVDSSRSITVSTLREAEYFAGHRYTDILCSTAIVPAKFAHAARIQATHGCDLILVTDAPAVVHEAARFARAQGITLSFLVEVDCGEHRSGLPATAVGEIVRAIH